MDTRVGTEAIVHNLHSRFNRITIDPNKPGSEAYIGDARVAVSAILSYLGSGKGVDEILREWPELEREDIFQALAFAAWQTDDLDAPWMAHLP
jgi:uncharacterized protein (DUF433 family)